MCPAGGTKSDLWQQAMAFLWQGEPQRCQETKLSLHQGTCRQRVEKFSNTPCAAQCEWPSVPIKCICRGHRMFLLRRWVRKPWEKCCCCCWDCWIQSVQHRLAVDSDSPRKKSGWMLNFRSDLTEISIFKERRYCTNYNRCVFSL